MIPRLLEALPASTIDTMQCCEGATAPVSYELHDFDSARILFLEATPVHLLSLISQAQCVFILPKIWWELCFLYSDSSVFNPNFFLCSRSVLLELALYSNPDIMLCFCSCLCCVERALLLWEEGHFQLGVLRTLPFSYGFCCHVCRLLQ